MGNYHTVYIGAGVDFLTQIETYETESIKCECKKHHKDNNFCSDCGSKIEKVKDTKERILWCEDLIGNENFMQFFKGLRTVFLSNIGHGLKTVETGFTEIITELESKGMILEFKEKHKEDIELLEKKLKTKLEIKLYCIHDYS